MPSSIQNQSALLLKHLCSRIFARNDYGTQEALIAAINRAAAIPETEWRRRKSAFNEIGENAPMKDDGYILKYEEVPAFLSKEAAAFQATLAAAAPRGGLRLETIHFSADRKIGLSTIAFTEGALHHSACDWGSEYPDEQTENVSMVLYGANDQILDRALIDGDTWREIDEADPDEFYEAVFHSQSIEQALQERAGHTPSIRA